MSDHTTDRMHPDGRHGRGAVSNRSGRYEAHERAWADDGWNGLDQPPPPLTTSITRDTSRGVITRNNSPDIGFDRSINPYRGCEHGCIYCFARPTHAWLGLSPGLDFESRLFVKPDAPAVLERELRRRGYRCQPIALGTNTDPYQPTEKRLRVTREILKVLAACDHPLSIVTKSNLVCRDIDILAPMAARGLAKVAISVTSLDRALARRMEPRAATPERRLSALAALSQADIPTAVMVAPVIPALNDMEIEAILGRAAAAGARGAGYILLRLPLEIKALWREWLDEHYPDRASRIMRHIREARGGRDYDGRFHRRMVGGGPYAEMIGRRFDLTCRRLGLDNPEFALDSGRFQPPPANDDQLSLF
ncbi:MAG: PA0069 family radical SAM protein [Alphaproteobacteria bacterium]|jgi:DNA repair photolyase|nr:PA0069 family radical SAM protein [Alphaproteobacteria bacterium]MDP6567709.1 PA0069 family radical SAM protein [Alphaproteobacteria bacterium]MDP6812711.1 PA0069 family radical SAM protein [Alphaproteobacteria bacterium]